MYFKFVAYSAEAVKSSHSSLEPEKETPVEFLRTRKKGSMQE